MAPRLQLPTQKKELHLRHHSIHHSRSFQLPELLHAHNDRTQPWKVRSVLYAHDFSSIDRLRLFERATHLHQESLRGQKPVRFDCTTDLNRDVPLLLDHCRQLLVVTPIHSHRTQLRPIFLLQGWDLTNSNQVGLLNGLGGRQGQILQVINNVVFLSWV